MKRIALAFGSLLIATRAGAITPVPTRPSPTPTPTPRATFPPATATPTPFAPPPTPTPTATPAPPTPVPPPTPTPGAGVTPTPTPTPGAGNPTSTIAPGTYAVTLTLRNVPAGGLARLVLTDAKDGSRRVTEFPLHGETVWTKTVVFVAPASGSSVVFSGLGPDGAILTSANTTVP